MLKKNYTYETSFCITLKFEEKNKVESLPLLVVLIATCYTILMMFRVYCDVVSGGRWEDNRWRKKKHKRERWKS